MCDFNEGVLRRRALPKMVTQKLGASQKGVSQEGDSEGGASQKMEDLIWVDIEDDVALVTVICLKLGDRLTEGLFGGA